MKIISKELNKTQLKKIEQAKTWFKKGDRFTLDYALKNFKTGRAKESVIDAYDYLEISFKSNIEFKKIKKFYNSKNEFEFKDFLKLCKMIKKFVKSFN